VHPGTTRFDVRHIGTSTWLNILVPQTGNAVDGFCPGALQFCALVKNAQSIKKNKANSLFIQQFRFLNWHTACKILPGKGKRNLKFTGSLKTDSEKRFFVA
jgi:hypothetical protein